MTTRWTATAACVLCLCLVAPAAASDALDGTYQLDPKASDDPSLLGELIDLPAAAITVMRKMKTKLTIDGAADQVTITIKTPLGGNESTTATDGSTVALEDGSFGAGTTSARWEKDGTVLVFVSDTTSKDGKPIHNVTRRYLEEPDTLIQQFEVSVDDADPVTIRRVFRRI